MEAIYTPNGKIQRLEAYKDLHMFLLGHVQKRAINSPVRKNQLIQVKGTKEDIGRPKTH